MKIQNSTSNNVYLIPPPERAVNFLSIDAETVFPLILMEDFPSIENFLVRIISSSSSKSKSLKI